MNTKKASGKSREPASEIELSEEALRFAQLFDQLPENQINALQTVMDCYISMNSKPPTLH